VEVVLKPEVHFWTIQTWMHEKGNHNFSIFVSNRFLEAAKIARVKMSADLARRELLKIANKAGYKNIPDTFWEEDGLTQINHPGGGGVWLVMDKDRSEHGKTYSTHNCDHPHQQSFLMAAWLWWASVVEMFAEA